MDAVQAFDYLNLLRPFSGLCPPRPGHCDTAMKISRMSVSRMVKEERSRNDQRDEEFSLKKSYDSNIRWPMLSTKKGIATITISSTGPSLRPPPCEQNSCIFATPTQKPVFFSGLYISAIACGGIKSTEQFDKQQEKEKVSYFSWSYAIINLAMFTAGTVLVWTEERVSWGLGYSICASCTAVDAMIFAMGATTYRILLPEGSPLAGIFQVLTAFASKAKLKAPLDSNVLYNEDVNTKPHLAYERLEHTDQFRFLDKAAIIIDSNKEARNMKLCTVTEVERLKILLRLLPI